MSIHIIVDGYNLIRQSDTLSRLDDEDIQLGREALLDRLAAYRRTRHHRITVVFDGANAPLFSQHKKQIKGILVKFSHSGESADAVIERMVHHEREKALVVSSDLAIVNFAAARGAATISSPKFEEKINLATYITPTRSEDEGQEGWVPTTKKKGPSKRLSKKKRRDRIKIRKL
ncbi:MAG: NYN domain-containing protein [Desulfobacterales bacterium]|nr:MAG: NYN domain-containing protein [Desulfobacterales bacterium]